MRSQYEKSFLFSPVLLDLPEDEQQYCRLAEKRLGKLGILKIRGVGPSYNGPRRASL